MTAPAEDPRGGMGRHRAPPPEPKPPDRFTAPIAAAAAILTFASLIALYAPGLAPDATAAGRHGVTVSTAARTVSVPLEILPATPPTIGASDAWDPETDAPVPVSAPVPSETFAGATGTATAPQTPSGELVATTTPLTTTRPPTTSTVDTATTARTTTTSSPSPTAAASTTSSATPTTEEPVPTTTEPTATAEPTDIGDVIDEVLGTEVAP